MKVKRQYYCSNEPKESARKKGKARDQFIIRANNFRPSDTSTAH